MIVWDRLFGTYAEETEEPYFGLVHRLNSWDIFQAQTFHLRDMVWRFYNEKGLSNKLGVLWKGPAWVAGAPRLGLSDSVPEVDPAAPKHGVALSSSLAAYVAIHFVIVTVIGFFLLTNRFHSYILHLLIMGFVIYSLQTFAAICDRKPHAAAMEMGRVMFFLVSELVCYLIYKDEFIFLWCTDTTTDPIIPMIYRPVKMLRMAFVLSLVWILGRAIFFPEPASIAEFATNIATLEPLQDVPADEKGKPRTARIHRKVD